MNNKSNKVDKLYNYTKCIIMCKINNLNRKNHFNVLINIFNNLNYDFSFVT